MDKEAMLVLLTGLAKGIAQTFGTNCETLIQDLSVRTHPILAIFNGHVTHREVGSTEDVFGSKKDELDSKLLQQGWGSTWISPARSPMPNIFPYS